MNDLHHHLAGLDGFYNIRTNSFFTHFFRERLYNLKCHVSFQQGPAHLTHGRIDISLRQGAAARQLVEYARQAIT